MDKEQIVATIKEKVNLPDDVAKKAAEAIDGKSLVANKDDFVKTLVEKVGIDEKSANSIYNALCDVLSSDIVDKVKGLFGK